MDGGGEGTCAFLSFRAVGQTWELLWGPCEAGTYFLQADSNSVNLLKVFSPPLEVHSFWISLSFNFRWLRESLLVDIVYKSVCA